MAAVMPINSYGLQTFYRCQTTAATAPGRTGLAPGIQIEY
jgi:hypothetical protein